MRIKGSPKLIEIQTKEKKMKLIVATEIWNTKTGRITKAVVRTPDGRIVGATNQTKGLPVIGSIKVSDMIVVGR